MLGQRVQPYKTRVLNPLTGCIVRLKAQIPAEELSSVVVMTSPLMVFVSDLQNCSLRWADQSTEEGPSALGFGEALYRAASCFGVLHSITYYAGDIFATDKYGSIISSMTYAADEGTQLLRSARTLRMSASISGPTLPGQYPANLCYLVESKGELLYVVSGRVYNGEPVVYRVDTKMRVLEPVRSIGSRSIFVGQNRCISIDTSKVHTVQSGSIYYADLSEIRAYDDGGLSWQEEPEYVPGYGVGSLDNHGGHFHLDEMLAEYCRTIELSELQRVQPYGELGFTYYDYYDGYPSD